MPDQSITTSQFAILGIVGLRGPSTPYDVKRALGRVAPHFWSVPHTQCYTDTERLAQSGLLSVERETEGRRRRCYSLTEAGRQALADWLAAPTPESMQIRDVAELKLFCGELGTEAATVALARQQVASYRERLASLDELERRFAQRPELGLRLLPARLGRRVYEAALEFWQDIVDQTSVAPAE